MEVFLRTMLPRLLPEGCSFDVHPFQGKTDLMAKLEARLRAYARWLPAGHRLVVLVDRDRDDCMVLKRRLNAMADRAGLRTRTVARATWQVANRIAIEELEAWYFGDWQAVRAAYPRVSRTVPNRQGFRNPDEIPATWEAFERLLQRHGYVRGGLRKVEAARAIAAHIDPARSQSQSFRAFRDVVVEAVT